MLGNKRTDRRPAIIAGGVLGERGGRLKLGRGIALLVFHGLPKRLDDRFLVRQQRLFHYRKLAQCADGKLFRQIIDLAVVDR